MSKYVIVGGSVAAISAVEAIREVDPAGTIAIIAEEPFPTYSRPLIGDYVSGEATWDKMMYRSDRFWSENKVETFIGSKAVRLNFTERFVETDAGKRIEYEKLLLATGSEPLIPKIDGSNRKGVFVFITLADAENLKAKCEKAEKAVVVGGGLIGVCAADALTEVGAKVTIVELKERLLSLLFNSTASRIIEEAARSSGVDIVTGHTVARIGGMLGDESKVGIVVLDSGETIPCDIVVLAAGVRPRVELVARTGLKVNKGIVVDRFMHTNIPDVYACGDVAEAYDFVSGEGRVLPQWPTAYMEGRTAGHNMAGISEEYSGGTVMSALKYFNVPAVAVGITNPMEDDDFEVLTNHDSAKNVYKKVVLKDGVIKGFILVNDICKAGVMYYLMQMNVNVARFKSELLSEDFGFISLPEHLRKKILKEVAQ